ncbi:MAG TPA: hypothetical protein VEB22_15300 [Phycisphaerales bacterium]|nr:hypothetical protein [Phycisphaerales bacterium]
MSRVDELKELEELHRQNLALASLQAENERLRGVIQRNKAAFNALKTDRDAWRQRAEVAEARLDEARRAASGGTGLEWLERALRGKR